MSKSIKILELRTLNFCTRICECSRDVIKECIWVGRNSPKFRFFFEFFFANFFFCRIQIKDWPQPVLKINCYANSLDKKNVFFYFFFFRIFLYRLFRNFNYIFDYFFWREKFVIFFLCIFIFLQNRHNGENPKYWNSEIEKLKCVGRKLKFGFLVKISKYICQLSDRRSLYHFKA